MNGKMHSPVFNDADPAKAQLIIKHVTHDVSVCWD